MAGLTPAADGPGRFRELRSERLVLSEPSEADLDDLFRLHSDPRSWEHRPNSRHEDPARSRKLIERSRQRFASDGLSYWVVRTIDSGELVGWGGCSVPRRRPWWNLTYRVSPDSWGQGFGAEIAEAGVGAAREVGPDLPVLAFVMASNAASIRIVERLCLDLYWSGPDRTDPGLTRCIFLDRPPTAEAARAIAKDMIDIVG